MAGEEGQRPRKTSAKLTCYLKNDVFMVTLAFTFIFNLS